MGELVDKGEEHILTQGTRCHVEHLLWVDALTHKHDQAQIRGRESLLE